MEIVKIYGGGQSWYYLVERPTFKIYGAAHEDDKDGMKHLEQLKQWLLLF